MAPLDPFNPQITDSSASVGRQSHIHFLAEKRPPVSAEAPSPSKSSPIGLGLPSSLRTPSVHGSASIEWRDADKRRRVRSTNGSATGYSGSSRIVTPPNNLSRRRTITMDANGKASSADKGRWVTTNPLAETDDFEPGVFSDEYDLSPLYPILDPTILEEVQHALKVKMRRESRIQPLRPSGSSFSSTSSALQPTANISSPAMTRLAKPSLESELDFRPSVGADYLHPVPLSFNQGASLDWSISHPEDDKADKKWPISMPKRRTREKQPMIVDKDVLEKQESLFAEKLIRIRASIKPHTARKVSVVKDQLNRRYALLFTALERTREPIKLSRAVEWYSKLDPVLQTSMDELDPFSWLKHLRDRRTARTGRRLPWHLSALIVEEYIKTHSRQDSMITIPEDGFAFNSLDYSPSPDQRPSPSYSSSFEISSHRPLEASLSRRRSLEGHVSFEPIIEASSKSPASAKDSHRSYDGYLRSRKSPMTESPRSSIYSVFGGSHQSHKDGVSPASSRVHIRGIGARPRGIGNESDGASSSHQSQSDDYRSEDNGKKKSRRRFFRPAELDLVSRTQATQLSSERQADDGDDQLAPGEWTSTVRSAGGSGISTARAAQEEFPSSPDSGVHTALSRPIIERRNSRILQLRGYRTSLPSPRPPSFREEQFRNHVDDEHEYREYERRAQLLEDATAQNQRNRQLLQRVSLSVKEYEAVQSRMSKALGLTYKSLPQDLLDALSHDPAVITGHTRSLRGWRAVENVNDNIQNQTETIQHFLQQNDLGKVPRQASILDNPLNSLIRALEILESRKTGIVEKAKEVAEVLARVKKLHASVKSEYNDAVTHTSAVYPELSHIVALEESYKDHYQQLWEFGMDALTFLLDTVTPFWRNYGKIIGVDVQDFLIVPWYRNEFTGEAKRYPITSLPRRSLRHWVGLVLFFFITFSVVLLQGRAALTFCSWFPPSFITNLGLQWLSMPAFGIIALIQFCAVLVEASVVIAQLVVVLWWIAWWARIVN
ncbi:hypothetical protein OF83DRAFT_1169904 [Amylostereum chailletii]|nr:hypothetical protein OF83DRAFT_1169904 [Amylostereum chailletii]